MNINKKISLTIIILLLACVALVVQAQRHIITTYSVEINAPVEEVWNFLSDNRNANGWSVIFDHIEPMVDSPVPEGEIGALRRCYRNSNKEDFFWDERTLTTEPYNYRSLRTYNISNTSWEFFERYQFTAHQTYENLGNNKTRLTFGGDLDDYTKYTFDELFVFWATQYEVERVFKLNLENIKAMIEQKQNYARPHPWEEHSPFDA
jgi:uncharacterized protein YndB with AHSA1/START domain